MKLLPWPKMGKVANFFGNGLGIVGDYKGLVVPFLLEIIIMGRIDT